MAEEPGVVEYEAPWAVFGLGWSYRVADPFRLSVGSFTEGYGNQVHVLTRSGGAFSVHHVFDHPYPATRVGWVPDPNSLRPDLIATTGDLVRIWDVGVGAAADHADNDSHPAAATPQADPRLRAVLNNNSDKAAEFCAPLTAFDWNETDPSLLGTASVDTTCTVWDIETQQPTTNLIAHDKEVFDIQFARGTDVFSSVGADGSVRLFDRRSLDHSTIIYESPDATPLLLLRWNKQNPNYLATVLMGTSQVIMIDIRIPSIPCAELFHPPVVDPSLSAAAAAGAALPSSSPNINAISWAPNSAHHLCTGGDAAHAYIWDLSSIPEPTRDPSLTYHAGESVSNVGWCPTNQDWLAVAHGSRVEVLRV